MDSLIQFHRNHGAELAEIDSYNLTSYPKVETDIDDLFGLMNPLGLVKNKIKSSLPKELKTFLEASISQEIQTPRIQAEIPFTLDIK